MRRRLFAVLDAATDAGRVVLVAGGAGSGKSVLLSSWLADRSRPAGWASLDRSDSDAHQLAGDLLAALQSAAQGAPTARRLLQLRPPPGFLDPERFADALVGALGSLELDAPLVLVVDDVQHVGGSAEAVALLDHLLLWCPARVRVVLASRADPPLALGRLLVDGRLEVLRQDDLAFTPRESAQLLRRFGVAVGDEQAVQVHEVTSGWPVGLRLAAHSLRGTSDVTASVAAFSARDRALSDYLIGEVLDKLPARLREFVLRATVDDEVCAGLADAATGDVTGDAMLAECERQNLFLSVIRDDGQCRWYGWHHLFAAHMRRRALFEDPESARRGELAAARWWRPLDPVRSARHAVAGGDAAGAEVLLAEEWLALSLRGSVRSALETVDLLPPAGRYAAEFLLARCMASVQVRDIPGARESLRRAGAAAELLPAEDRRRFDVRATVLRLFLVDDMEDLEGAVAAGRGLLHDLDHGDWYPDLATTALTLLGLGMGEARLQGEMSAAIRLLRRACAVATDADLPVLGLLAQSELCVPLIATGDLPAAEEHARSVLARAAERGWEALPLAGPPAYLGWLAYWRDDQVAARAHLEDARAHLLDSDSALDGLVTYFHTLACLAVGDLAAARDDLRRADRLSDAGHVPPYWPSLHVSLQAELAAADGNLAEAARIATGPCPGPSYRLATCARADLLRRNGAPRRSLAELRSVPPGELYANVSAVVGVLRCLAHLDLDQTAEAHSCLEDALTAAAPAGLLRPFTAHRDDLVGVLSRHLETGTAHPVLVARLLDRMSRPVVQASGGWDERLTPRELCILRYLRTPMSTAEIAADQFVSVNTIKTHLAKIYRKLGVPGRRDAVRRGHELGLFGAESAVERPPTVTATR